MFHVPLKTLRNTYVKSCTRRDHRLMNSPKWGRQLMVVDSPRSGRPSTSANDENIYEIKKLRVGKSSYESLEAGRLKLLLNRPMTSVCCKSFHVFIKFNVFEHTVIGGIWSRLRNRFENVFNRILILAGRNSDPYNWIPLFVNINHY